MPSAQAWNISAGNSPVLRAQVEGNLAGYFFLTMYACDGAQLWNDYVDTVSTDPVVMEGLSIVTPAPAWIAASDQAFDRALKRAREWEERSKS